MKIREGGYGRDGFCTLRAKCRWKLGVLGGEKSEEERRKFWGATGRRENGDGLSFWNFDYFAAGEGKPGL
jgi:hypothetical protein